MSGKTADTKISKRDLVRLLQSGGVYADRWPAPVREQLDVPDPLTVAVTEALKAGRSVLLAGNAGDGKTHLAKRALDALAANQGKDAESADSPVIFLPDISTISDADAIRSVDEAAATSRPVLICINEGPLNSIAVDSGHEFFVSAQRVLHRRSRGYLEDDPENLLILNLAGRQLAQSAFVGGVLDKLLPLVNACSTCASGRTCPRVVGAKLLRSSKLAKHRFARVLQMASSGSHLTARDIWALSIDLFFGWTCERSGSDADDAHGFFWMRLFDEPQLGEAAGLVADFDPVHLAVASLDSRLWRGAFEDLLLDKQYPAIEALSLSRRGNDDEALVAFKSAKRFLFFFSKNWDPLTRVADETDVGAFTALLEDASRDRGGAIGTLIGLINQYRLSASTEQSLYLSRHHGFAADRRPRALVAFQSVGPEQIGLRVPFEWEAQQYPDSGFRAQSLLLHWSGRDESEFTVDFSTWQQLRESRTVTSDRDQEILDFGLDIFIAQGHQPPSSDPEMHVYDHERHRATLLRIRRTERRIEVLK